MNRIRIFVMLVMFCVFFAGCQTAKVPATATEAVAEKTEVKKNAQKTGALLLEGFESPSTWIAVGKNWGDGDCSKSVAVSEAWATEGKKSLVLTFNPLVKDKGATCFTEMLGITDFSSYEAIVLDVLNPSDKPMQASVAVTTGDGWEWFESNVFDLVAGENKDLRIELFNGSLKSAGTGWKFTSDLKSPDNVLRVAVKFFGPEGFSGTVNIDNIRLMN